MAPGFPSQRGYGSSPENWLKPICRRFSLSQAHLCAAQMCHHKTSWHLRGAPQHRISKHCVCAGGPRLPSALGVGVSSVDYRTGACLGSFFHVWAFNHWLKVLAIFSPRYLFSPSRGDLTSLPSSGSMSGYCCCWHTTLLHPLYRVGGREVAVLLDSDGKPAQWCYANLLNPGLMPYLQGFLLCIAVPPAKQSSIISFQLP